MPKKPPLVRLIGKVMAVEVGERPKGVREKLRAVSLQVSLRADDGERLEWFALGPTLRLRVKELVPASDELIGRKFELFVNGDGQVEEFRRLPD